jgi:alpha-methylacyl-CoA racemase
MPPLLEGLRVLDLGIWRPVPYATQLLTEMGAEVLKVEPPGGDPMRVFPELFAVLNAGKRSMVVDLKTPRGREEVLELAADSDVFMEGFRPGVAERLGVAYEAVRAVNGAVVYCSISGYGSTGPLSQLPGHDVNYQAYSGVMSPKGQKPISASIPVGDLGAGMAAAMATIAACLRARTTGEGERIDVGIADVLATWTGAVGELTPTGSTEPMDGLPGYGTYRTSDGRFVTLGVLAEDRFWSALCEAVGLEELGGLGLSERVRMKKELDASVASAVSDLSLAQIRKILEEQDVPVAPVLTRDEMLELEHFHERGTVLVDRRAGRSSRATGHPVRFQVHPPLEPGPVPTLDENRRCSWTER